MARSIKAAHVVVVTPKRAGLYETTRELVLALQEHGVNSRMVDPTKDKNTLHPGGHADRGAPFADMAWALDADVIINHSGFDGTPLAQSKQPVIHVAHGRPKYSFIGEVRGGTPVYSYCYLKNADPRFKAVVTFWPEHEGYLQVLWPDKPIHVVSPPVDLVEWSPGPNGYDFGGHKGQINIVSTDAWREDVDPFVAFNTFILWARDNPGARLHVYARNNDKRGWPVLFRRMTEAGVKGEIKPWVEGLKHVYRSADAVITSNVISTRTVREAMACGCPVARVPTLLIDEIDYALTDDRDSVRHAAEQQFSPARAAEQFTAMLESIAA